MSRFRPQRQRSVPGLNLASLPDLIFTVLFFFMLVTHMRDVTPQVHYELPQGSEVAKDASKAGLVYIFIGKPVDAQGRVLSDQTRIQMNHRFVSISDIEREIAQERSRMSESDRQRLTVSIRADRDTRMAVVNDVKQALRRAGALNINYSATGAKREKESKKH